MLRYPGRLLAPGEFVPPAVVDFIGRQLDLVGDELADYAVRSETRHEHLAELRRLYGFRSFAGGAARELGDRLREEAQRAQSNEDLVRRFVEACHRTRTILPATTTIERLCADALVDAERQIEARIAERVPPGLRRDLEHLLEETVDAGVTRFVWLRQFEPGSNSADANRLLDRREHLRRLDVPEGLFHDVPAHRITRLRRQGERYFADGLRELPDNRRLAILAVCAFEWEMFLADAVVETHDRIVGRTYREAARTCDAQLGNETASVREALRAFAELGTALIGAKDTGAALDAVIADGPGWEGLGDLVARAAALANTVAADPLNHVLGGYSRFRRYTPRMLRTLDIEASPVAKPLLEAVDVLRSDATARPTGFLRPNSKWSRLLRTQSDLLRQCQPDRVEEHHPLRRDQDRPCQAQDATPLACITTRMLSVTLSGAEAADAPLSTSAPSTAYGSQRQPSRWSGSRPASKTDCGGLTGCPEVDRREQGPPRRRPTQILRDADDFAQRPGPVALQVATTAPSTPSTLPENVLAIFSATPARRHGGETFPPGPDRGAAPA